MDGGGRVVYSSPADIFRQQKAQATSERETPVEEKGREGTRKAVHWDPNLIDCSQPQAETTSTLTSTSQVMPHLLQNLPHNFHPLLQAFSGVVVEREVAALPSQQVCDPTQLSAEYTSANIPPICRAPLEKYQNLSLLGPDNHKSC